MSSESLQPSSAETGLCTAMPKVVSFIINMSVKPRLAERSPRLTPLLLPTQKASERSYTPIKSVGDGSFGTVWLVDWHTRLPPNTPLSAMQCGDGAKPEWAGKRLVALKQMKKRWEGGWDECKKLKELEVRLSRFFTRFAGFFDISYPPLSEFARDTVSP